VKKSGVVIRRCAPFTRSLADWVWPSTSNELLLDPRRTAAWWSSPRSSRQAVRAHGRAGQRQRANADGVRQLRLRQTQLDDEQSLGAEPRSTALILAKLCTSSAATRRTIERDFAAMSIL
jgi:hypothetical protein